MSDFEHLWCQTSLCGRGLIWVNILFILFGLAHSVEFCQTYSDYKAKPMSNVFKCATIQLGYPCGPSRHDIVGLRHEDWWRLVKTGEDWQKHTRRPDFGSSSGQKASTSLSSSLISLVHWGSHVVFHIFPLIYDHCIMKIHTARLTYRIWTYHPHRTSEILGALTDGRLSQGSQGSEAKSSWCFGCGSTSVGESTGQNCAHGENFAQNFTIPTIPILTCPYLAFGIITVWNEIWLI
jgi:hypothetical protein